jgi:hypothetical protein
MDYDPLRSEGLAQRQNVKISIILSFHFSNLNSIIPSFFVTITSYYDNFINFPFSTYLIISILSYYYKCHAYSLLCLILFQFPILYELLSTIFYYIKKQIIKFLRLYPAFSLHLECQPNRIYRCHM